MTDQTPPADMPPAQAAPPPAPMPPPMTPMAPAPGQVVGAGVRPTGATVVAVIEGIIGVLALLAGLLFMVGMSVVGGLAGTQVDTPNAQGLGAVFAGVGIVFGVIIILIGLLYLAIAYGAWKGRSWAWMLGMIVSIIAIVFGVLGLSGGVNVGSIISLALPIIVVYFLWQPEVKRWLGRPA